MFDYCDYGCVCDCWHMVIVLFWFFLFYCVFCLLSVMFAVVVLFYFWVVAGLPSLLLFKCVCC